MDRREKLFHTYVRKWQFWVILIPLTTFISIGLKNKWSLDSSIFDGIGILFPIVFAVITVIGFVFTFQRLIETNSRFHNFEEFHYKAISLMKNVNSKVSLQYYTPNIGILTTKQGKSFKLYMEHFDKIINNKKIDFKAVFINPLDLYLFYKKFEVRYPDTWLNAFWHDCIYLHNIHSNINNNNRVKFIKEEDITTTFIISEQDSIIINPLYLPKDLEKEYKGNFKVSFLGMQTDNRAIRKRLEYMFDILWEHKAVNTHDSKSWKNNKFLKIIPEIMREKESIQDQIALAEKTVKYFENGIIYEDRNIDEKELISKILGELHE